MANTYVDYTATAAQTDFNFSFPYLETQHIIVEINGVATSAFTVATSPAQKVVLNSGATAGVNVRIRRKSQPDVNLVDFENGSVLTETELDKGYRHNRYLNEEIGELNSLSLQKAAGSNDWDTTSNKILNVGTPTLTADAATKNYVDQKVEQIAAGASTPPSKWQFTGTAGANTTYTVTGADVLGDSAYDVSVNGLVKEPTVDYTVDPDTDTLTIIPSLAGGEDIVIIQRGLGIPLTQGTIGTAQINDGAVTNAKILDGAVTTNKLATNAVTTTEILDDAVTPSKLDETQAYTVNGLVSNGSNILITRGAEGPGLRLTYDAATDEVRDLFIDSSGNFQFTNFSGTGTQGTLMTLDKNGDASITGKVKIGTITNNNFALNASNAALGSLVIYEPTGSSTEGGQININKAGIATPSAAESDSFVIDAYDTGSTGSYGLAANTDVLRIIGTPGAGEKSIVITEDADVITNGDIEAVQVHSQLFVLKDGVTAPSTLSGQAAIYVDSADGDLKIKFSDGTVKTIVTDS